MNRDFFLASVMAHEAGYQSTRVWLGAALVHKSKLDGEVLVSVENKSGLRSAFMITVGGATAPAALNVECSSLFADGPPKERKIKKDGFIAFTVTKGTDLYRPALMRRIGGGGGKIEPIYGLEFDGEHMDSGDAFSMIVTKPGDYIVTNTKNGSEMRIKGNPLASRESPKVGEKLAIDVTSAGFAPPTAEVSVLSGLAFYIKTPAALSVVGPP